MSCKYNTPITGAKLGLALICRDLNNKRVEFWAI